MIAYRTECIFKYRKATLFTAAKRHLYRQLLQVARKSRVFKPRVAFASDLIRHDRSQVATRFDTLQGWFFLGEAGTWLVWDNDDATRDKTAELIADMRRNGYTECHRIECGIVCHEPITH